MKIIICHESIKQKAIKIRCKTVFLNIFMKWWQLLIIFRHVNSSSIFSSCHINEDFNILKFDDFLQDDMINFKLLYEWIITDSCHTDHHTNVYLENILAKLLLMKIHSCSVSWIQLFFHLYSDSELCEVSNVCLMINLVQLLVEFKLSAMT